MTKANIELPNGTKISVDGSPEEVAKAVKLMQGDISSYSRKNHAPAKQTKKTVSSRKVGLIGRVRELIREGLFKKQKTLQEVKDSLAEKGHIYPVTSISPALVRLVRARELRRIEHNKKWTYVEV